MKDTDRFIALGIVIVVAVLVLGSLHWYVQAQTPRKDGPFVVLVQQTVPPVTLIEHRPTGTCFLAYTPGGIVLVDSALCQKSGGLLPLLLLPGGGLPVSPEKAP